jgi:hypothetical protein
MGSGAQPLVRQGCKDVVPDPRSGSRIFRSPGPAAPDRRAGPEARAQKASALITSPPWLVPAAIQVRMLMEFLTNRTLPSHIVAFTPPEW